MELFLTIFLIDKILTGTKITTGQSEPENNSNERVLHTPQRSRTGVSSSDEI